MTKKDSGKQIVDLGNKFYDTNEINPSRLNITSRRINYWIDKKTYALYPKTGTKS